MSHLTEPKVNPQHPDISNYILYTLNLFISFGADKENSFINQSFLGWWSFLLFSWS